MTVQIAVWPRGTRRRYAAGPLGTTRSGGDSRRVGTPVYMSQVGALQQVNVSSRYEDGFGGTDLLSWTIDPLGGFVGGIFRPGDHCRITQGGGVVGEGEISEVLPNADGTVEFHARGYAHNLSEYDSVWYSEDVVNPITGTTDNIATRPSTMLALNDPNATSPSVNKGGWEYAKWELGMPINQVVGTVDGWDVFVGADSAQRTLKLGEVLTFRERLNGRRWAVWGRTLFLVEDPTEPMWQIDAPEGVIGVADTDYYTHVGIWYRWYNPDPWLPGGPYVAGDRVEHEGRWYAALLDNTEIAPPPDDTASWTEIPVVVEDWMTDIYWEVDPDGLAMFDTRTIVVDYRAAGLSTTTDTTVEDVSLSLIEQVKGRFIFTGSFTVGPDGGLTSINGGRPPIAFIRAGQGIKLNKLRTTQGNLLPDFFVIGRTDWSWQADESESLTITPMGAVPRDFSTILAGIPYNDPPPVA
jgi:hypothetical protein